MAGKFEIYKDQSGHFRFRLKARNGEIVGSGDSYPTKADAKKGITAVKKAAEGAETVDLTVESKQ